MAVSSLHEGLVELVRKQPGFIPQLLTQFLDIRVPPSATARTGDSVLNEARAAEYRADGIVLMYVEQTLKLGAIFEAQLQEDERKRYTWPHYTTGARAHHECPFVLLVVAPDARVAHWARQPIDLGFGSVFQPHVIDPEHIPKLTEAEDARRNVPLAALSVVAHGKGDPLTAARIAVALIKALSEVPETEHWLYLCLIENALSEAAREMIKMLLPEPPKYFSESFRRSFYEGATVGMEKGMAKGKAEALLLVLAQRALAMTDDQRRRVSECRDVATLDGWLRRAISAASVDDVLG